MKKSVLSIFVASTILSSLGGCSSQSGPAQIDDRQNMVFTKYGTMEMVKISPGDSIDSIAERKSVPVEVIAAVNNLPYPYHLYNYRTVMVPTEKYHKVKGSESLRSISKKYNVDVIQLMEANNISERSPGASLPIGTVIKIPSKKSYVKHNAESDRIDSKPYKTTKSYDVMEIEEVPNEPAFEPYPSETETSIEFEKELRETLGDKAATTQPDEPEQILQKPTITESHEASSDFKTMTPLNAPQFMWPLQGKISREKKDGVTIFAPLNAGIKSCGNGKVIFAENDNGEYGNLIIIKHSDGYLSAYAHTNQMLVKKGDEVTKGQTIAKVGQSGKVNKPQMFFSIRKGKEILDPEKEY